MLTKLFSSPVRVKILKFLVVHSNQVFNAADIVQGTGAAIRSVNKEIVKLVETQAVLEELKDCDVNGKKVKIKHYRVNAQFIIFEEIKNIFLKLQVLNLDELREKISKLGLINYVVLTGNFVGNAAAKIDLLVVGRAHSHKIEKFVKELEHKIGWEINWAQMELAEYDYRNQIGDMFLFDILSGKKIEVYSKFV